MSTTDLHPNDEIPLTKDQAAARLAREYMELDSGLIKVFRILDSSREADPAEPIKLLEVYRHAIPSGVILPLGFPANPQSGMYYPAEVVQIAPDDLPKLHDKTISLPDGWELGQEYLRDNPEGSGER